MPEIWYQARQQSVLKAHLKTEPDRKEWKEGRKEETREQSCLQIKSPKGSLNDLMASAAPSQSPSRGKGDLPKSVHLIRPHNSPASFICNLNPNRKQGLR